MFQKALTQNTPLYDSNLFFGPFDFQMLEILHFSNSSGKT